jgi:hypothetical protein
MKNNTAVTSIFVHFSFYCLGVGVTESVRTAGANGPFVSAPGDE